MRLFHYALIPVLDNKHLVSQLRECLAIKRQWEKGTLKHRLVSYVMNYSKEYFMNYVSKIDTEMTIRKIKHQDKYYNEILDFCEVDIDEDGKYNDLIYPEHNDRYLMQCLYNLEEKADRGIITKEEWGKITEHFIFKKEYNN